MKKFSYPILAISVLVFFNPATAVSSEIEIHPAHFGAFTSFGMFDGDTVESEGNFGALENQPFTRLGAWISVGATVDERLDVSLLLALMKWNSLPVTRGSAFTRNQLLSPGMGHAIMSYKFGEVEAPYLTLKIGDMPYSYSPAKNLGGHLYSAGTYPGYLWSNFWTLINGASYNGQGIMANMSFFENSLKVDLTAFLEHGIEPHFDISPGVVASYKVGNFLEIGGGAVFAHLISVNEDITTPKSRLNAYTANGPLSRPDQASPGLELNDSLIVSESDPRLGQSLDSDHPRFSELAGRGLIPKYYSAAENGTPNSQLQYYTYRGTKVMGRLSLTPFEAFGEGLERMAIYGEVTLLGVNDYPFYYEKKSERLPIMAGMNVPLPGFELNLEVEHYKNKFRNHIKSTYEYERPIWEETPETFIQDAASHDNGTIFWSISAKKTVLDRLAFNLKFARDYIRTYNFFGNPTFESANKSQGSYYWVLQTELNI